MLNRMYIRINLYLYAIFLMLPFISNCASFMEYGKLELAARDNYNKGNYDTALSYAISSLKLKPDYDKSQSLIKEAFPKAVEAHESNIKELNLSTAKFKWDTIVSEYEQLIKLNKDVKGLPTLTDVTTKEIIKFEIKDYTENLLKAKTNAAETHYQEGLRLIKDEKIDIQKQAAKEFKTALAYIPGYKDSENLYEKGRRAGIKRIAIIPFEDKSGKKGQYGAIAETVMDKIVSNVMNDKTAMEFLELISREQLEQVMREQQLGMTGIIDEKTAVQVGKVLGVHEIVTGKITQIAVTPERTTSQNVERKKTLNVYNSKIDKFIPQDFHAIVTIYIKAASASINGSYQIIDVKTAMMKKQDAFNGRYDFKSEWATYTGDDGALSSQDRSYGSEEFTPSSEEMVNKAADNLTNSLASTLKSYIR